LKILKRLMQKGRIERLNGKIGRKPRLYSIRRLVRIIRNGTFSKVEMKTLKKTTQSQSCPKTILTLELWNKICLKERREDREIRRRLMS